ncbi:DNA repair protein [Parasphingopyxis sp. CP4]|uniref:JAB domain-containing protein n=1 Tax=Parasphingopyxis sp. CP4 TaxID=2724527 RepID=UPI0015A32B9E|nr:JAB domain-containing protein [Parasphingopyxis sp. CP4]QLC20856.1 DNA repair protein [Parasphingopyxis sp. CP4]
MRAILSPFRYNADDNHFFASLLLHHDHEHAIIAHLGAADRIVAISETCGGADAIDLPLRQIVGDALAHDAHDLVIAHNHPSGDPRPSDADIETTRALAMLLRPLGIRIHDHLILTHEKTTSFRVLGWL